MREFLARQHWNFSTASVLREPDHRLMGGLLLPFPPRIPAPRFSLKTIHGDLGIAPEWRFSPQPKTCTEI
jgi:hypothetical protein